MIPPSFSMKKSSLIHLVWALVAIAAYAFGSKFTGNSGSTAQEEETANPSNRSLSSRSSNANGNISSANGSNSQGSRRSNSQDSSSTTPLSENEIRQLGAHFKSAKGPIERRLIFSQILENLTVENAELMREQILHLKDNSTEFREFHPLQVRQPSTSAQPLQNSIDQLPSQDGPPAHQKPPSPFSIPSRKNNAAAAHSNGAPSPASRMLIPTLPSASP